LEEVAAPGWLLKEREPTADALCAEPLCDDWEDPDEEDAPWAAWLEAVPAPLAEACGRPLCADVDDEGDLDFPADDCAVEPDDACAGVPACALVPFPAPLPELDEPPCPPPDGVLAGTTVNAALAVYCGSGGTTTTVVVPADALAGTETVAVKSPDEFVVATVDGLELKPTLTGELGVNDRPETVTAVPAGPLVVLSEEMNACGEHAHARPATDTAATALATTAVSSTRQVADRELMTLIMTCSQQLRTVGAFGI